MQNNNNIETLLSNGEYQEAAALLGKGLMTRPNDPGLLTQMARLHFLRKNGNASLTFYQQALRAAPNHLPALLGLGELYLAANQLDAARQQFQRAIQRSPGSGAAWRGLANVLLQAGEVQQAGAYLKKAVDVEPEEPAHRLELGRWYAFVGAFAEAEPYLRDYVTVTANRGEPLLLLGDVYWEQEKSNEAHQCYVEVEEEPAASLARVSVTTCLMREERVEEALRHAHMELESGNPYRAELLASRAKLLLVQGEMEAAEEAAQAAVQEFPDHVGVWEVYLEVSPERLSDADLQQLHQLATEGATPDERARAGFALAHYYERCGNLEQEMEQLEVANGLIASQVRHDARPQERLLEKARQYFMSKSVQVDTTDRTVTPVFVLGLPRSGTTLTEQILSSHSQVSGSGESLAFKYALPGPILELLDSDDDQWVSEFRRRYLEYQASRGFTSGFVVDKAMTHYRVAGLLARAFPEARFIAVHRHPLDVCLGGWKRKFAVGIGWSYRIEGLAHSVKLYNRAIRAWKEAGLPILEINYEDLVSAPNEWVPKLAQHLGLEVEEAMFHPDENRRVVLTASTAQVRSKLHAGYANRWRRYREHLEPFIAALRKEGVEISGLDMEET